MPPPIPVAAFLSLFTAEEPDEDAALLVLDEERELADELLEELLEEAELLFEEVSSVLEVSLPELLSVSPTFCLYISTSTVRFL